MGDIECDPSKDGQACERNDEGRNALIGNEPALQETKHGSEHEHGDQHQRPGIARRHEDGTDGVDQRNHGADRQVDAAGDDDKRHGDGNDEDGSGLTHDVQQVACR